MDDVFCSLIGSGSRASSGLIFSGSHKDEPHAAFRNALLRNLASFIRSAELDTFSWPAISINLNPSISLWATNLMSAGKWDVST